MCTLLGFATKWTLPLSTHIQNGPFHPSIVDTIDPSTPPSWPSKSIMDSPIFSDLDNSQYIKKSNMPQNMSTLKWKFVCRKTNRKVYTSIWYQRWVCTPLGLATKWTLPLLYSYPQWTLPSLHRARKWPWPQKYIAHWRWSSRWNLPAFSVLNDVVPCADRCYVFCGFHALSRRFWTGENRM